MQKKFTQVKFRLSPKTQIWDVVLEKSQNLKKKNGQNFYFSEAHNVLFQKK